jgi:DNA polymerase-3 subunit epsilon
MNGLIGDLLVFDVESTGVNVELDRILTCYAMLEGPEGTIKREWRWTINPGVEVPEGAAAVHGMTTEWIRDNGREDAGPAIFEIFKVLFNASEKRIPIVAYNARYDLSILHNEMIRHGQADGVEQLLSKGAIFYDASVHEKERNKYVKGSGMRTLKNTCLRYGIEFDDEKAHAAQYDVQKTAELSRKLLAKERKLGLVELMPLLIEWKREQDESLEKYFTKAQKKNEDGSAIRIDRGWPLITTKGN